MTIINARSGGFVLLAALASATQCVSWAAGLDTRAPTVEVIGTTPLPGLGVSKNSVPANVQTATDASLARQLISLPSFLDRTLDSVNINEAQSNSASKGATARSAGARRMRTSGRATRLRSPSTARPTALRTRTVTSRFSRGTRFPASRTTSSRRESTTLSPTDGRLGRACMPRPANTRAATRTTRTPTARSRATPSSISMRVGPSRAAGSCSQKWTICSTRATTRWGVLGANFFTGPGHTFDATNTVNELFLSPGAPLAGWVGIRYSFGGRAVQ